MAARVKRMAFEDSKSGVIATLENAMLFNGRSRVFTARGIKPATRRKQGGYTVSVNLYTKDGDIFKHVPYTLKGARSENSFATW